MRIVTDEIMEQAAIAARAWAKENLKKTGNDSTARWGFEAGYRSAYATLPPMTLARCGKAAGALAARFGGVADNYGEIMHIILKTLEREEDR
jgi:hypothetical protein